MNTLHVPKHPEELQLKIDRFWNGEACTNEGYHALVWLSQMEKGLLVRVEGSLRDDMRIPDAPAGRLDGLWEHDVVEVFLVGENPEEYLEIELGAGGHWLVLGFDGIRHRSNEYVDFEPEFGHVLAEGKWTAGMVIPWEMVPKPLTRLNAYAILGGEFLAYAPVPGEKPDYHQPGVFPSVYF